VDCRKGQIKAERRLRVDQQQWQEDLAFLALGQPQKTQLKEIQLASRWRESRQKTRRNTPL